MSQTNGNLSGLSQDDLRAAVRAVLRDVLPADVVAAPTGPSSEVVISTDADLTAFVRRVAALCEDPGQRADLQDGRHGFRLAGRDGGFEARKLTQGGSAPLTPQNTAPKPPVLRVERGAVTERTVVKAAADGTRLVLGRGAVLTPLAKDKARTLGVEIEKER